MTDPLRPFVYRHPDDDDLYWDCACCGEVIHESVAPSWYGKFTGQPYCQGCQDSWGHKADEAAALGQNVARMNP